MELPRTSIETVRVMIEATVPPATPPEISVGLGTASPGPGADWVSSEWASPGVEVTLQIAGVDAPDSPALRMAGLGHNYLYARFGTIIRKVQGVVEVR